MKLFKKHEIAIDFILIEVGKSSDIGHWCGGKKLWVEVYQGEISCKSPM